MNDLSNKTEIRIQQFDEGSNQGMVNERGHVLREIMNVQLLESHSWCVSGKATVRIGKFVEICGDLREIRYHEPTKYEPEPYFGVTLHGSEELPKDLIPDELAKRH